MSLENVKLFTSKYSNLVFATVIFNGALVCVKNTYQYFFSYQQSKGKLYLQKCFHVWTNLLIKKTKTFPFFLGPEDIYSITTTIAFSFLVLINLLFFTGAGRQNDQAGCFADRPSLTKILLYTFYICSVKCKKSSLPFGGKNLFNSLPRYLFCLGQF